eukprot:9387159-Pyramimonas_sp.AAC.1
MYSTKNEIEKTIETKPRDVTDNAKGTSSSSAWKRMGREGGGKEDTEKEVRAKQVVAFGFEGTTTAQGAVQHLEQLLQQLLGVGAHATATTITTGGTTNPKHMGMIEFPSISAKVDFWKKGRAALESDEH